MGLKLSTHSQPRMRTYSGSSPAGTSSATGDLAMGRSGGAAARARARSLGSFQSPGHSGALTIPTSNGAAHRSNSPDSDSSSPEEGGPFGRAFAHSLPVHLFALQGIKCPVCSKFIPPDDIECHLVICLTKPRITYNEDVLPDDKGECVICFEDLQKGDTIARLPCLCIYHKACIDKWFEVNRSCPEHPAD
ncbi:E3 ubiquitin-protein ligase ZNRF2-like [Haliotis rufescens]|uniref:E3 ubiquitin-protein ligase ZNRF2-like n=1 Tax=Haliotis rufescens TaxID=6454 RepID=UPI001EB0543C|nr:E3 ubiquitin-protein ligase ZNRF2-like [Haliotis rufescens]